MGSCFAALCSSGLAAYSLLRRKGPLLLALGGLLAFSSSSRGDADPSPAPSSEVKASQQALLGAVDEITRKVVAIRGLPTKSTFARGVLTRQEITQRLKERIHNDFSPEEVKGEALVLKRMGLLPVDADYEKLLFDLLSEQVAGFYDPYRKTLYIADWLPVEMQRPALAHEIQHALQDQHFDLKKLAKPLKSEGDRQLAQSAVVEGDGTAVMMEFAARSMGTDSAQLPTVLFAVFGGTQRFGEDDDALAREVMARGARVEAGAEEGLGGVDVSDAGEDGLEIGHQRPHPGDGHVGVQAQHVAECVTLSLITHDSWIPLVRVKAFDLFLVHIPKEIERAFQMKETE